MTGLQRLRLDALLTVEDLSKLAKVAPGTIRRIEAGKPVTVRSLAALSTFFAAPASDLVRPAGDSPRETAA